MATDHDMKDATGVAMDGNHLWLWCSPFCPEGKGKRIPFGEL
jgi:hypothetical protein